MEVLPELPVFFLLCFGSGQQLLTLFVVRCVKWDFLDRACALFASES